MHIYIYIHIIDQKHEAMYVKIEKYENKKEDLISYQIFL